MFKYKIILSYDGTRFSGWQFQLNAPSIQGCIEEALAKVLKQHARVVGAGRTDAGVHALGQTAHFAHAELLDCRRLLQALNGLLPHDIRIKEVVAAPIDFHAQHSALGKIYHYHLWLERIIDPFLRLYRLHYSRPIHLSLLKEAAQRFIGKRDFATFANLGSSEQITTVRTISRLDVVEQEGGCRLEFEGDGFLYKMVRTIVGTLLDVAIGKRSLDDIETLFAAKDRRAAGMAVFPSGLFLVRVHYPSELEKG